MLQWIVTVIVPVLSALSGVAIGAWLASRRERNQHKLAFLEKQLSRFYSPMLGLRNEIKTHSELRLRIQNEANQAWRALCAENEQLDIEKRQQMTKERSPEFTRIIEYDNTKLHEDLLPAYRRMVDLFRDQYWLAEVETRSFYAPLLEFVEIWNRWIDEALPREVLQRLQHSEEHLVPSIRTSKLCMMIRRKLRDASP
ncbi:MAG TPA: hypothetical protein VF329_01745 [Gammaproteobacteria bacterium]